MSGCCMGYSASYCATHECPSNPQPQVWAVPKTEIEKLQDEIYLLKTAGIIEIAVRNPSVMEYMKHWEERAEKAEATTEVALREAAQMAGGAFWNLPTPAHWDRDKDEYTAWCTRQSKRIKERILGIAALATKERK